ncbi:MAG: aminotransferase [Bacteroidetes bacterium]|nr:MAG: aminotransferase [Bacteroidota bacterium]PIE88183.1 MAG: aminotransferase [Bacteroidota bacterium]
MKIYPIPMVPGPTSVPEQVLEAGKINYGSADLEADFFERYAETEQNLQVLLGTVNRVAVMTGEGMLALWSALKSTLLPGDKVLAVSSGVFGTGIGEMAKSIGCEVKMVSHPYDSPANDFQAIEDAIATFKPKMITAVHCETPSGVMNPLKALGELKERYKVPLLYVDAVASVGGAYVKADENHIDLCLGGAQKVLSAPANSTFLSVSERAWEVIEAVNYVGYDALLPFKEALENRYFPYSPSWVNIEQLARATSLILNAGLDKVVQYHEENASFVRDSMKQMGYKLFVVDEAYSASTVSAFYLPERVSWELFDRSLRSKGLVVGGSYGPLAGKIFRLGHMGSQSNRDMIKEALKVLGEVNFS